MSKSIVVGGAAVVGIIATLLALASPDIERTGYFKSEDRHRVMAYAAPPSFTAEDAADLAERVMHTEGRTTLAVIYTNGAAPAGSLTTAADMITARTMITHAPFDAWAWRIQINPRGDITLSDQ